MRTMLFFSSMLAVGLAGCAYDGEPTGGPTYALVDRTGRSVGSVRIWESPGAVTFRIDGRGLPHGIHGIHVHTTGRCDPPGFTTAGPHWNPTQRQHGFNNPAGPHAGDMPNVTVAGNGVLGETVTLAGARFATLFDADGASLVLHAAVDDYRTDPSGNSGDRIACAAMTSLPPPAAR